MSELKTRLNISDSVRFEVTLKNLDDNYANASTIYFRIEDYDGSAVMSNSVPTNFSIGRYRLDVNLYNASFDAGAYLFIVLGKLAGFAFHDTSYFEVKEK